MEILKIYIVKVFPNKEGARGKGQTQKRVEHTYPSIVNCVQIEAKGARAVLVTFCDSVCSLFVTQFAHFL